MSGFTRSEIEEMVADYKAAVKAALAGQQYSMDVGGQRVSVTRSSLPALERGLAYWKQKLEELDGKSDLVSLEVDL